MRIEISGGQGGAGCSTDVSALDALRTPLGGSLGRGPRMRLAGRKIGVLIEGDFYEDEILYYKHRFPEDGAELHFLSRLWGQPSLTFEGHEYRAPFHCNESFEDVDDAALDTYAAIIVPSGMVSDRLRYTE